MRLQVLLKRYISIIILALISYTELFCQSMLGDYIVNDSLIKKLKIKKVTRNWFESEKNSLPSFTDIEYYNEKGQITQGIYVNHTYHKFIENYSYNSKKTTVTKKQYYYDWNPHRERRKGDTLLSRSISKYDMVTKRNLKAKKSRLDEFRSELTYDENKRLIKRVDSVKFGYKTTLFVYNSDNRTVERKCYMKLFFREPILHIIDSFYYNSNKQISKEINLYDFRLHNGRLESERVVKTNYYYLNESLIAEKSIHTTFPFIIKNDSTTNTHIYRYEYEYY